MKIHSLKEQLKYIIVKTEVDFKHGENDCKGSIKGDEEFPKRTFLKREFWLASPLVLKEHWQSYWIPISDSLHLENCIEELRQCLKNISSFYYLNQYGNLCVC